MSSKRAVSDGTFLGTVIVDSREKNPYTFELINGDAAEGGGFLKVQTMIGALDSGDYSLEGYEAKIAIERKSLADLYSTIGQGRERFEREFDRLNRLDVAVVIIESTWPEILDPPESITRHTQLSPKTISRTAISWTQRYPRVHWWTCGCRQIGEAMTFRILERYYRNATQ
jgi:DNA excision repair protein ERCC-4